MDRSKCSINDLLAIERTNLANERTLLAYTRTALGLVAAGAALWKLFEVSWARVAGAAFLLLGPAVMLFGLWRFFRIRRSLRSMPPELHEDD